MIAYGSADATATPSSLPSAKSRMVYPSGAGLPRLSWKKAIKRLCVCVLGKMTHMKFVYENWRAYAAHDLAWAWRSFISFRAFQMQVVYICAAQQFTRFQLARLHPAVPQQHLGFLLFCAWTVESMFGLACRNTGLTNKSSHTYWKVLKSWNFPLEIKILRKSWKLLYLKVLVLQNMVLESTGTIICFHIRHYVVLGNWNTLHT